MKSVAKRVIEVPQPEHPYFERIYVVLRADSPSIRISTARAQAEKYVAGLVCCRRALWPETKRGGLALAAAALVLGIVVAALLLL